MNSPTKQNTERDLPTRMDAIVLETPNEDIRLSKINIAVPECGDNEVLVKVEYVGLTTLDAKFTTSGFASWQYPHVIGLDAVGTVVKAQKGQFPAVGDRVSWHSSIAEQGVLSDYAKVLNFAVSLVPDNIAGDIAAAVPCAGMSALVAIEKLQLEEGDTILIEGGAGAVGQFAIQLAKQKGATVFSTASKKNHALLKKLGADHVFDYNHPKLSQHIKIALGAQGFDAVIDSIGGATTLRDIALMKFCGRIACLRPLPEMSPELLFTKSPNISVVSLSGAWLDNSLCAQQNMSFMNDLLLKKIANGDIKPPTTATVAFNPQLISNALGKQLDGGTTIKQVVKI